MILICKIFEGLTERGECSMVWLFSINLHLIINDMEEELQFHVYDWKRE